MDPRMKIFIFSYVMQKLRYKFHADATHVIKIGRKSAIYRWNRSGFCNMGYNSQIVRNRHPTRTGSTRRRRLPINGYGRQHCCFSMVSQCFAKWIAFTTDIEEATTELLCFLSKDQIRTFFGEEHVLIVYCLISDAEPSNSLLEKPKDSTHGKFRSNEGH